MPRVILALAATLFLGACASTAGTNFSIYNANRVQNGMTREEVIRIMGSKPNYVQQGGKLLTWSYAKVGLWGKQESRAVSFRFDENGRANSVPEGGAFGDTSKFLY